mgnify:FL=1
MSVPNQPPQQGRNTPMAAPPQEFAPYQGGAPQGTNTYPGGVPYQGYPQAYAGGPQVQMPPRVNWVSIACGAAVWALHLTTYLGLWLLTSTEFGKTHHSVLRFVGFIPQMTISVMVPLNMTGLIIGIMRLSDRSRKWRLNWLGIVLNVSPYIYFAICFILWVMGGSTH